METRNMAGSCLVTGCAQNGSVDGGVWNESVGNGVSECFKIPTAWVGMCHVVLCMYSIYV